MYVCMHACMHACMYACMHVCMYACMHVCMYACMHEEEEEEICLFNIVCSYTNSAMLITYTCRETPNGWNLISRLQGAT